VDDNLQFFEFFAKEIGKVVSCNLFRNLRIKINIPVERSASQGVHGGKASFQKASQGTNSTSKVSALGAAEGLTRTPQSLS
jgi:hypothetical protein